MLCFSFCSRLMLGLLAHMLNIMSMVMPCLDLHVCMHVLCSHTHVYAFTCLYALVWVLPCLCVQIYMLKYISTCLHAYFHAYMCRSRCLHTQIDVLYMPYAIFHVLVHFMPCLCAQAQTLFVMPCAIIAPLFLLLNFLVFQPNGQDPIQTLWSLHVYACLLLCFMLVLASLVLGFAMFSALHELNLVWLHPTPMRPCSDITLWKASPDARLLRVYPSHFRSVRCYAQHACLCHSLDFFASLHAYLHVYA